MPKRILIHNLGEGCGDLECIKRFSRHGDAVAFRKHLENEDTNCFNLLSPTNKKGKPVRCIETGKVYSSMFQAVYELGGSTNNRNLVFCLQGKRHTWRGYHWEYADKKRK